MTTCIVVKRTDLLKRLQQKSGYTQTFFDKLTGQDEIEELHIARIYGGKYKSWLIILIAQKPLHQ